MTVGGWVGWWVWVWVGWVGLGRTVEEEEEGGEAQLHPGPWPVSSCGVLPCCWSWWWHGCVVWCVVWVVWVVWVEEEEQGERLWARPMCITVWEEARVEESTRPRPLRKGGGNETMCVSSWCRGGVGLVPVDSVARRRKGGGGGVKRRSEPLI